MFFFSNRVHEVSLAQLVLTDLEVKLVNLESEFMEQRVTRVFPGKHRQYCFKKLYFKFVLFKDSQVFPERRVNVVLRDNLELLETLVMDVLDYQVALEYQVRIFSITTLTIIKKLECNAISNLFV
jgi:hypothetical protein